MRSILNMMIFLAAMLIAGLVTSAYATETIRACAQADGGVVYTNKDIAGCHTVKTPELSVVPSYPKNEMPVLELPLPTTPVHNPLSTGSPVNDYLCKLYNEWLSLNEETEGGHHFRDSSQKVRYTTLWRTFSTGFISVNCKYS
jgi:hypothetical protein